MIATRTATRPTPGHVMGALVALSVALLLMAMQARAEVAPFLGTYVGSAEVTALDGSRIPRDMSVEVSEIREGFRVKWTSVSYRTDGRSKEKSYAIDFVGSDRDAVYAAAQRA